MRKLILLPLTTLYRAPSHLETKEQGRLYLDQLVNAVSSMRPTEFELEEVWNRIVREHKTAVWPTPAVICSGLHEYRRRVAEVKRQSEHVAALPRPKEDRDDDYDPVAFREALETCRREVERKPNDGFWRRMLEIGEGLERGVHLRGRAA